MSLEKEGIQNLKQSEHKPGFYNKDITHPTYDTFRKSETIELKNSLDDLVLMAISEVKEWYKYEVKQWNINKVDYENSLDEILGVLNYKGALSEIIDGSVPVYTHELKGLYFINENALIEAFENSGLGGRSDFENGPLGFEGASIYCYIEQEVNNWLSDDLETWFSGKFWEVF